MLDVAIIGGGAAGFFAAINIKEKHPDWNIQIFEKSPNVLGKVKISGGGRCNVSHHCFEPRVLSGFYPRGHQELLSVFNRFNPKDTIQWFKTRNVELKTESDGRIFPVSNDSQTIINCFMDLCRRLEIRIHVKHPITSMEKEKTGFQIRSEKSTIQARKVIVATGSSEFFWSVLEKLGHSIVQPVPSLFTFNVKDKILQDLMGLSIANVEVRILADKELIRACKLKAEDLCQEGPLLITHWGLSGPAILKLSSVGARILNTLNYKFRIRINFCGKSFDEALDLLLGLKLKNAKKQMVNTSAFDLPLRFWHRVVELTIENSKKTWADCSKAELGKMAVILSQYEIEVTGKSTNKDEFVTAGGVDLKEVDFKTMESKRISGLYLAGEVLNIDALTGGFNFQAAWSEAWVISESVLI